MATAVFADTQGPHAWHVGFYGPATARTDAAVRQTHAAMPPN